MNKKKFFQQLTASLKNMPGKERFLQELHDHLEDKKSDQQFSQGKARIKPDDLGEPQKLAKLYKRSRLNPYKYLGAGSIFLFTTFCVGIFNFFAKNYMLS